MPLPKPLSVLFPFVGPIVLATRSILLSIIPLPLALFIPSLRFSPRRVSVWPNERTQVRRRGPRAGPAAAPRGQAGRGREDGTDLKQHGRQSQIPKRQGEKECVGLKREQREPQRGKLMATSGRFFRCRGSIDRDFEGTLSSSRVPLWWTRPWFDGSIAPKLKFDKECHLFSCWE